MNELERRIADFVAERELDPRGVIFDVRPELRDGRWRLVGSTSDADAVEALVERAGEAGIDVFDEVRRLPDERLGTEVYGLVRVALAPVHAEPRVSSTQVSQYVLGHRLDLLERHEEWWRVRGEDGYIGWMHQGYVLPGDAAWAQAWERAEGGEPVVALGSELLDEAGRVFMRLPWGARVIRDAPRRLRLPDGRRGEPGNGELVDADRLLDWFPPRGESVTRTARRWIGTPYLWGGVTPAGADCSGFAQSVFWLHGLALPRDSDQQARAGIPVDPGDRLEALRPGDLLFFEERPGRVTHVAISLGGAEIIHSAISNGGVDVNDLNGELELERRLRSVFVHARRIVPD